jgi:ethanolamine permease
MFLAWLNYRGVLATLTFNLIITAIAFAAIIILFLSTSGVWAAGSCSTRN